MEEPVIIPQPLMINELDESDPLELSNNEIEYLQEVVNEGKESSRLELIPVGGALFRIRANGWVGALSLPSGRSLYIEPKIKLNFYRLLAYVLEIRDWKPLERDILAKTGTILPEIIAGIFIRRVEDVLS